MAAKTTSMSQKTSSDGFYGVLMRQGKDKG